jgi:two-component system chemotaxis response regulator CheY
MLRFDESRPASVVDRSHAHVVLLDSNPSTSDQTHALLTLLGCDQVCVARDVTEFHEALLFRRCDLLLTTWGLPSFSGQALLWLVRHLPGHTHLPVLIVAQVTSELVREAAQAGVNGFVPRPLSAASLEDLLRIFLGPRARSQLDSSN